MIRFEETHTHILVILFIAFLPPEPTYSLIPADEPVTTTNNNNNNNTSTKKPIDDSVRYRICFSDKAEWQHSANDMLKLEAYYVTTSRHNRIACIYVNCTANPKFYILFSHGNAVDLGRSRFFEEDKTDCLDFENIFIKGQMASFFIVLGTRLQCNIFSYDYSGYGASQGKASEKNMYADIEAAYNTIKQRYHIPESKIILYGQSIGKIKYVELTLVNEFFFF